MKKYGKFIFVVLIFVVIAVVINFSSNGFSLGNKLVGTWYDENETLELKRNGKYTAKYYWFPTGSYEVKGNTITFSSFIEEDVNEFELDGDTLTLRSSYGGISSKTVLMRKK